MIESFAPYLLVGGVALGCIIYALRQRHRAGALPFAWMVFLETLWMVTLVKDLLAPYHAVLHIPQFWETAQIVILAGWALACLAFTWQYTRSTARHATLWAGLAAIVTVIIAGLAIWPLWPELFRLVSADLPEQLVTTAFYEIPLVNWLNLAWLGGLGLVSVIILLNRFISPGSLSHVRISLILIGLATLFAGIGAARFHLIAPFYAGDPTPLAIVVSQLLMAGSIFSPRRVQLVPAAREHALEHTADVMLTIDPTGRIADLNPAALALIASLPGAAENPTRRDLLRKPFEQVFSSWTELREHVQRSGEHPIELAIEGPEGQIRYFTVNLTPLQNHQGRLLGQLVVAHDITLRKQLERNHQTAETLLQQTRDTLQAKETTLLHTAQSLHAAETRLEQTTTIFQETETTLHTTQVQLQETSAKWQAAETTLHDRELQLQQTTTCLLDRETTLSATAMQLQQTSTKLQATETTLHAVEAHLQKTMTTLQHTEQTLNARETELRQTQATLQKSEQARQDAETTLHTRETELRQTQETLQEKEKSLLATERGRQEVETRLHEREAELRQTRETLQTKENCLVETEQARRDYETKVQQAHDALHTSEAACHALQEALQNAEAAAKAAEETRKQVEQTAEQTIQAVPHASEPPAAETHPAQDKQPHLPKGKRLSNAQVQKHLADLPPENLRALKDAAAQLNPFKIARVIEPIWAQDAALADALQAFAQQHNYKQLSDLVEKAQTA